MIRNSSRKREIREPSVGARWSEADGELALELPTKGLWLCRFGRISRRRKGRGMIVPVRAREFSREAEWYRAIASLRSVRSIPQGRFFLHTPMQRKYAIALAHRRASYSIVCCFCNPLEAIRWGGNPTSDVKNEWRFRT